MSEMPAKATILAIDDEEVIQQLLQVTLESNDYKAIIAKDGKHGLEAASQNRPDLILLDLGLPDIPGIEVLKRLRAWSKIPVIVLTVKESDADKVALLDAGADDYLTKPFSVVELLARIRVALRHYEKAKEPDQTPLFKTGPLEVNFETRQVRLNHEPVKLTVTEYELLRVLIQNAGKVVTQRQLLKEVWGGNAVEHTHYLRVYIGHLRQKIEPGPDAKKLIVTESGVGYRLSVD
jgi:two-component system KDP operon response regulator KdpE